MAKKLVRILNDTGSMELVVVCCGIRSSKVELWRYQSHYLISVPLVYETLNRKLQVLQQGLCFRLRCWALALSLAEFCYTWCHGFLLPELQARSYLRILSESHTCSLFHLRKVVKKETSGLFLYGLLTVVRCAEHPAKFFAK